MSLRIAATYHANTQGCNVGQGLEHFKGEVTGFYSLVTGSSSWGTHACLSPSVTVTKPEQSRKSRNVVQIAETLHNHGHDLPAIMT